MSRAGALLLILAVLVFIASALLHAVQPGPPMPALAEGGYGLSPWQGLGDFPAPSVDLSALFLQPRGLGMAGLLGMTWLALAYHAGRRWLELRRMRLAQAAAPDEGGELPPQSLGPPTAGHLLRLHRHDDSLAEHAPLIVGLLAGAVWPWLLRSHPVAAFLLSAAMLAGFLAAALRGVRVGSLVQRSSALGFVAGWGLLVSFAVFAGLLRDRLGVPQEVAAVVALLIGSVAAVSVQLRLGRRIGFSVALIWGLIGIAAATVTSAAAIATMTVIAIAIIAVALVRVLT